MRLPSKARRAFFWIGTACAVVSITTLFAAPNVRQTYASKAVLTQIVQVDPAGESLFGDGATPIGSPQLMIIDDPKAVVPAKGTSDVCQVDDGYLKKNNIYPLQLKTVDFFVHWANMISVVGLIFGLILSVQFRKKS